MLLEAFTLSTVLGQVFSVSTSAAVVSAVAATTVSTAVSPTGTAACPVLPAIADLNAIAADFPPNWVTASIVAGDTVATDLWNSIQANESYATALAFPPNKQSGGNPVFTGYDTSTDPACWWSDSNCVTPKQPYLPPDISTCQEPAVWGLSVDDGPLDAHCHLYELYKENNIKASLFYIGSNVQGYPSAGQQGYEAGHHICVHTWSHNLTSTLTNEEVFAELYYTKLIIKRLLGFSPRCWRPPFGDVDDRVRTIAWALDMITVIWDEDTNDWQLGTAVGDVSATVIQQNFDYIIGNVSQEHGIVVLDHELSIDIANMWIENYPTINKTFNHIVPALTCNNITSIWAEEGAPLYPDYQNYLDGASAIGSLTPTFNATAQIVLANGAPRNVPFTSDSTSITSNSSDIDTDPNGPVVVVVTALSSTPPLPTSVKGITVNDSTSDSNVLTISSLWIGLISFLFLWV